MFHSSPVIVFVPHVVPPRPEHLLLVGVAEGAHQSRTYGRHVSLEVEFLVCDE